MTLFALLMLAAGLIMGLAIGSERGSRIGFDEGWREARRQMKPMRDGRGRFVPEGPRQHK